MATIPTSEESYELADRLSDCMDPRWNRDKKTWMCRTHGDIGDLKGHWAPTARHCKETVVGWLNDHGYELKVKS